MKLHCILLTLAVVNVSPIMTTQYANSVYITNKYIEKAFDAVAAGLETAISNIVNGAANMVTINLMLVVPEKAHVFRIHHDKGEKCIENLPETIAIADQETVRNAIHQVTKISMPQLEPNQKISMPRLDPNQNIRHGALLQLGEDRRRIIGKVTKNVLLAAIEKGKPKFENLTGICYLLGSYRSLKFPKSYIESATVSGNSCTLTSHDGRYKYHRTRVGVIVRELQLLTTFGFNDNLAVGPAIPYGYLFPDVSLKMNTWFP